MFFSKSGKSGGSFVLLEIFSFHEQMNHMCKNEKPYQCV